MTAQARLDTVPTLARMRVAKAVSSPPAPSHRLITVALAVACCMHGFAASSIATAVPAIGHALHAGVSGGEAPVTAFFLGASLGVIAAGRVADVLGARRLLLVGLGVVLVASLGSGLVVTLPELITARLIIGIGTASLYPAAIRLLAETNTARGLAITAGLPAIVAASELMFGLGPAVGGVLVGSCGWRVACTVLALPALAAIMLVRMAFPAAAVTKPHPVAAPGAAPRRPSVRDHVAALDLGGLLLAIALAATAAAVLVVPVRWNSLTVVVPAALLVLVAALALHCHRRRDFNPAIDLTVLCSRAILLGLGRTVLVYVGVYAVVYGLPLWLAEQGWTAEQSGAALLPIAVVSVGAVVLCQRAVRTRGPVPSLLAGACALALAGAGLLAVPAFPMSATAGAVLGVLGCLGVTCGAANLATQHGSVAASPLRRAGGVASWSRLVQFAAGQGTTVVVVQALPGTDTGLRVLAVGVVAVGVLLAATAAISPTLQGESA